MIFMEEIVVKNLKNRIIVIILIGFLLNVLIPISYAVNETLDAENEEIDTNLDEQKLKATQPIKSILNIVLIK